MTAKAHDTPAAATAAPTSLVGRVRGLCVGVVGKVWGLIAPRPLWQKLVLAGLLLATIGGAAYVSLSGPAEEIAAAPHATVDDALAALHEGETETALSIVDELKAADQLTYDERGAPAYIHGMIAVHEAAEMPYAEERQRLYLVAARYLDTAFRDGFPASNSTEGLVQLGECWHNAGHYARALPYLTQALKRRPRNPARVHELLAASYYRDANPQLKLAQEHLDKYLADRMLSPEQRSTGLVEQARILIDLGKPAEAEAVLNKVPEKSELSSAVNVLKARLLMQQASELLAEKPLPQDSPAKAKALYEKAVELLRTPALRDALSSQSQREAQYLLGVCYLKLEDNRAAENQFSRVRRLNLGMPEGIAAAIEEADLHRLQGKDEAALELYKEVLADLGDVRDYSNPWLPIDALRDRLLAAYRHYRDAEKFDVTLKLIPMLTPLVPRFRQLELEAEINRRWAEQLAQTAAGNDDARAQMLTEQARFRYHNTADILYRLSKSSRDSRLYPDYLWQSADAYRSAHDYHRTSRVMRMYLDENQPQRRADALLAIGESELALNNLEAALAPLQELLRDDAKHPLSYRARLVMHSVYIEQNKFAEARRMLIENLEHEALTPQSLEWRDSLFALADMLYRQAMELEAVSRERGVDGDVDEGRKAGLQALEQAATLFREGILKYSEALARYPEAPQAWEARYLMAECHRQAAKWPRKKMSSVSIETTRAALTRQMHEDLTAAHKLYSQLVTDLNTRQDLKPLNLRERNLLRNSYFLLADTLFDLGKYEEAIHAYSSATNRYQQRPEALEAFVQIASCYRLMNEPAKARGTLEQAKVMLRRIPADAEFTKTTRYDRDEWAALLDLLSTM